jgi:hypothetical protein
MKYKVRMTQLIIDEIDANTLIDFGIKKEWLENLKKFRDEITHYINENYEKYEEINKKIIGDFFLTNEVYTKVKYFNPKKDKFYITETGFGLSIFTANEIKEYIKEESEIFIVE